MGTKRVRIGDEKRKDGNREGELDMGVESRGDGSLQKRERN